MSQASSGSAEELSRLLADAELPEPLRRALASGAELERIELDGEGVWRHQGEPFVNANLAALFHRSIQRTESGTYWLHIAPFSYPITVADTPRYVRHIRWLPSELQTECLLCLSDGSEQSLDLSTLKYVPDRGLYCEVTASNGSRWPARFLRPAYYSLAEHIIEENDSYFLETKGGRVAISTVPQV